MPSFAWPYQYSPSVFPSQVRGFVLEPGPLSPRSSFSFPTTCILPLPNSHLHTSLCSSQLSLLESAIPPLLFKRPSMSPHRHFLVITSFPHEPSKPLFTGIHTLFLNSNVHFPFPFHLIIPFSFLLSLCGFLGPNCTMSKRACAPSLTLPSPLCLFKLSGHISNACTLSLHLVCSPTQLSLL